MSQIIAVYRVLSQIISFHHRISHIWSLFCYILKWSVIVCNSYESNRLLWDVLLLTWVTYIIIQQLSHIISLFRSHNIAFYPRTRIHFGRILSHFIAQMVSQNGFSSLSCISNYRFFIAFYRIFKRKFIERVRNIYRILSHKCRKSRIWLWKSPEG